MFAMAATYLFPIVAIVVAVIIGGVVLHYVRRAGNTPMDNPAERALRDRLHRRGR